ncbi:co-chaperone DjlA [Cellvibrio sp. PSBB006]|uniref:co-chaperone DjlA n=1 Tax=Cellvibrio sp. PSBB006 TaxID=1987723 RepID=UPI000B3BA4BE|nr:co-chaperone DjlA [Cellvibrio sp. PSBB006]ARU27208.1 molecular chaperone DjlA [Cellvibrio sp. PSBB006]
MLLQIIAVLLGVVVIYFIAMAVTGNKLGFFFSGQMGKGGTSDNGFNGNGFNEVEQIFFKTVFSLLGYVARKDGPVNAKEIKRTETFMEKMHLAAPQKRQAIQYFKRGAAPDFQLNNALQEFQGLARKSSSLTQILLVYLVSIARVDGLLVNKEVGAVQEIASALGYSNITFEQLLKMLSSQERFGDDQLDDSAQADTQRAYDETATHKRSSQGSPEQPFKEQKVSGGWTQGKKRYKGFATEKEQSHCAYDALGLTPSASDLEVRKAYQKLASQFHPDKLIGQGLPPFMIKALTERFKTIQSAYDCIKKEKAAA